MKSIILLVVFFFVFSTQKVFSQNVIQIESFETFIIKFKTDSVFQKSRLISPVTIVYSTGDLVETSNGLYEFTLDTIQVKAEDWKFESLSYTENVSERIINRIDGLIDFQITGLDNGILVIYTFVVKRSKMVSKNV